MDIDYDRDMKIDEAALDVEWLEQAPLTMRYARQLAYLRKTVKLAQERKKTVRSELIQEVNNNPEKTVNKAKPNAADIEAYYRTSRKYKEVMQEVIQLEEELEFTELAFQQIAWTRKKALEELVTLHGQQYFAGPSIPRNLTEEKELRQKEANKKVQLGRKKKKEKKE